MQVLNRCHDLFCKNRKHFPIKIIKGWLPFIAANKNSTQVISDLKGEVNIIEGKVDQLAERLLHVEKEVAQTTNKWTGIVDFIFKVGVVVIGSIILWKLGIKP